uniref:Uncharacterized protein n=1 Tax=Rhizophora mucronata TaxID=61149 RepID=A0A2P2JJJ9_RHIMU
MYIYYEIESMKRIFFCQSQALFLASCTLCFTCFCLVQKQKVNLSLDVKANSN